MTVSTDARGLNLAALLRAGDHIVWGQACGEPTTLVETLIAQAESIGNLSAFAATSFSGILTKEAAQRISLSSMGAIGALRTLTAANLLGVIPCHVNQVGPMIEQGLIRCDVAFVQVSPPDDEGPEMRLEEALLQYCGHETDVAFEIPVPAAAVRMTGDNDTVEIEHENHDASLKA